MAGAGARSESAQAEVMLQVRHTGSLPFGEVALSPARENRRQLVRRDDFQLIEGALLRLLVEPPTAKLRCVATTRPLHMVISDLDHQLRTKRFPSEILALAPAAQTARTALTALVVQGPILPRMTVDIGRAVGPQIFHQLAAPRAREVRADAHVLKVSLAVIEPEKQRSDCRDFIAPVPTEAGDDAIAFALVFHFQHGALVGLVDAYRLLRHHAVEAGALKTPEPIRRDGSVAGRRRQVQRRLRAGEQPRKGGAALLERYASEIPIAFAQNIKEDNRGGHLLGEQPHPRFCRVKAQLQRLEIEPAGAHNHDLAVEHAALRQLHPQRLDQLGVVAAEPLLIAALDKELVRITKNQRPEA